MEANRCLKCELHGHSYENKDTFNVERRPYCLLPVRKTSHVSSHIKIMEGRAEKMTQWLSDESQQAYMKFSGWCQLRLSMSIDLNIWCFQQYGFTISLGGK